jgi:hypothetical protein
MKNVENKINSLKAELSNQYFLSKAPKHIIYKKKQQLEYLTKTEVQNNFSDNVLLTSNDYYSVVSIGKEVSKGNREFSVLFKMPKLALDEMVYSSKLLPDYSNVNEVYSTPLSLDEIKSQIVLLMN